MFFDIAPISEMHAPILVGLTLIVVLLIGTTLAIFMKEENAN